MGNRQVLPKITKEEVDKMIVDKRVIFFVKNRVIDATDYLDEHPAGKDCLMRRVGKDCEEDYDFHSCFGRKLWDKMVIGYLKD